MDLYLIYGLIVNTVFADDIGPILVWSTSSSIDIGIYECFNNCVSCAMIFKLLKFRSVIKYITYRSKVLPQSNATRFTNQCLFVLFTQIIATANVIMVTAKNKIKNSDFGFLNYKLPINQPTQFGNISSWNNFNYKY